MNDKEMREKLADVLDKVHDKFVTEGGCDFKGWNYGFSSEAWVTEAVEELIGLGVTLTDGTNYEYGKKRPYIDGWERGDRLDDNHYVTKNINKGQQPDMRRRKAGDWEEMK